MQNHIGWSNLGLDSPFYGAWQPRLGFSYDMTGKGQTIAFGGWGAITIACCTR